MFKQRQIAGELFIIVRELPSIIISSNSSQQILTYARYKNCYAPTNTFPTGRGHPSARLHKKSLNKCCSHSYLPATKHFSQQIVLPYLFCIKFSIKIKHAYRKDVHSVFRNVLQSCSACLNWNEFLFNFNKILFHLISHQ